MARYMAEMGRDPSVSRLVRQGADHKEVSKYLRITEQMLPCEDWFQLLTPESRAFLKIAFKFLEGGEPPFRFTPTLYLFEIDSVSLLSADKRRLVKIGSGVPIDISCQAILHTIGW